MEQPFAWNDRHLRLLERVKRAKGGDVLTATTRQGQRILRAGQYVGTLRLGADTVTILPKIDYCSDATQSATQNLLTMLEQAGFLPAHSQDLTPLLRHSGDWFELLTRIFATELLAQWTRGPHRRYQLVAEELPAIRGQWQVDQHLRRPARAHRFDVIYDEFTTDNRLSQVLRYVVEQLWLRTRNSGNRHLLGELRGAMESVSLAAYLTTADVPPGIIDRLSERYAPLLNLARLFLDSGSFELIRGDVQLFTFVFDMNRLFEAFLVAFIRQHRATVLPEALWDCTLESQTKGHTRYLARSATGRHSFLLKPDLAVRRGDDFPLLLDAKYKRLMAQDRQLGVSASDFYQMFAYAHRYHAARVVMVYPQMGEPQRARFTLVDGPATITVATINLQRDLRRPEQQRALAQELRTILTFEANDEASI